MMLLPWQDLQNRFDLQEAERRQIELFQTRIPEEWKAIGHATQTQSVHGEWLGIYAGEVIGDPMVLFQTSPGFCPPVSSDPGTIPIPATHATFIVGSHSRSLIATNQSSHNPSIYRGRIARIRVIAVAPTANTQANTLLKYMAPISRLTFDPGRWTWRPDEPLYAYTANRGRHWRHPRQSLSLPISVKWTGLVPANFAPDWNAVWITGRPRKEAAFLWSFYHRAIAVNQWRHVAHATTSELCSCCEQGVPESLIHGFFECVAARDAWTFATTILYRLLDIPKDTMP